MIVSDKGKIDGNHSDVYYMYENKFIECLEFA